MMFRALGYLDEVGATETLTGSSVPRRVWTSDLILSSPVLVTCSSLLTRPFGSMLTGGMVTYSKNCVRRSATPWLLLLIPRK